jgi:hypothetical protein
MLAKREESIYGFATANRHGQKITKIKPKPIKIKNPAWKIRAGSIYVTPMMVDCLAANPPYK